MFIQLNQVIPYILKKHRPLAHARDYVAIRKVIFTVTKKDFKKITYSRNTLAIHTNNPALSNEVMIKKAEIKKRLLKHNIVVQHIKCVA